MRARIIMLLCGFIPLTVWGQSPSHNYILTETMLNEAGSKKITSLVYYDGLGRPSVQVSNGNTQAGTLYNYSLRTYDLAGNISHEWLPMKGGTLPDYIPEETLKSGSEETNGDASPYTFSSYDALDRPLSAIRPGEVWHSQSKSVTTAYQSNEANSVIRYMADDSGLHTDGYYDAGMLLATKTTDEDGNTLTVYKDMSGNKILERRSPVISTYYVYDNKGQLRFVLPPAYEDGGNLEDYAYEYRYDARGRCVWKRWPGCGYVTMTYDDADRIVATQDANQRIRGEHTYYEYDSFSRLTEKGTVNALSVRTVHQKIYYDNYSFLSSLSATEQAFLSFSPSQSYYPTISDATGQMTGSVIFHTDGTEKHEVFAYYYNQRGNMIQKRSTNHLGGTDVLNSAYSLTGKEVSRNNVHSAQNGQSVTESYSFEYDSCDRIQSITHSLNGGTAVVLASNAYDDLGRLSSVSRGGNNNLTTTYNYNVRSWTTSISSPLFSENLYYTDNPLSSGNKLYGGNIAAMTWRAGDAKVRGYDFNYDPLSRLTKAGYYENSSLNNHYTTEYSYDLMGNMLTLRRNGLQDGNTYGLIDQLSYTYNGNKLQKVTDAVEDPTWQGAFNFMDGADQQTEYEYDENGNLTKDLNKNILRITYNFLNLPKETLFMDGSYIHYTYDTAGTLLRKGYYVGEELTEIPGDDEEELTGFCLPDTHLMSVGDEEEEEELVEEEEEIPYTDVTDYSGNYVYENGTLRKILVEDGYITFDSNQPVYHFYLQDHLGNNRVVANASGQVEQVNHYYPYGGLMAESTGGDVQRYKYNGKELDRMLGLDWYDYGARHYDGALTMWRTMDPLCEKYYGISPYVYCGNNPINALDPDGRDIIPILFNSTDNSGAAVGFRCYSNAKVIAAMKEFGKTDYGNMFVASFIPEGKSQYGVKGSGKYSDHVFRIEQYNLKDPTDQHIHMGNRNGSFDVKIIDGRLNIVLSLDVINQNINELIETISHELTVHGYLLDKIVASYNEGGINAIDELLSKTSVKSEHHDIVTQKEHKGGKLYHTVRKQLTQNNTKLNDIFNERMEFYEKNY